MKLKYAVIIGASIMLATALMAFTWYSIESGKQKLEAQRQEQQAKQERAQEELEAKNRLDTTLNASALQTCLDNATQRYPWANVENDSKRDPANSQEYVDLYYKMKSEEEDSCKNRYPK
jgi:hypothetical protein